jgi:hypothetical protein
MNDELPEHLRPVRDLMMNAAHGSAGSDDEDFPPAPDDLLDDLEQKLGGRRVVPAAPVAALPWHVRLTRFFGSPGFGLAAAAIVVLLVAAPFFKGPDRFRDNGSSTATPAVRVVLVAADAPTLERLSGHSLIDPASRIIAENAAAAKAVAGPKLVLDFQASTLEGWSEDGSLLFTDPLPAAADQAAAIATALSRLAR